MRFGKAVFAEAADLAENACGKFFAVAVSQHALAQPALERFEPAFALPCGHGAAQAIGCARSEIGGDHCKLHDLLLENWHALGSLEHVLDRFRRVGFSLQTLSSPQIGM